MTATAGAEGYCIYGDHMVPAADLTDEHIWPRALGGDPLPRLWRTEACGRCNSASGVYIDGAFIKSWIGMAERTQDSRAYLSQTAPLTTPIPFSYLGELKGHAPEGETIDHWVQDCGAKVFHFRPATDDAAFMTYAGGDPRKGGKKKTAGRAYLALKSPSSFWQAVAVGSFNHHFKRAHRHAVTPLDATLVNELPLATGATPAEAADIAIINKLLALRELQIDVSVPRALGGRLQAKLGLALGYALFGRAFASTPYARELRSAFREADPVKLAKSKVRGSGILSGATLRRAEKVLCWPGAWLLWNPAAQGRSEPRRIVPLRPPVRGRYQRRCEARQYSRREL